MDSSGPSPASKALQLGHGTAHGYIVKPRCERRHNHIWFPTPQEGRTPRDVAQPWPELEALLE